MTPAETARVLAAAAGFDQRTVGHADVAAWHAALGELDFADARDAVVRHYQHSVDRVMPAHVLDHAAAIRTERAQLQSDLGKAHDYVGDELACEACGLPKANRRHKFSHEGRAA